VRREKKARREFRGLSPVGEEAMPLLSTPLAITTVLCERVRLCEDRSRARSDEDFTERTTECVVGADVDIGIMESCAGGDEKAADEEEADEMGEEAECCCCCCCCCCC
jgi:hypothetical protein